MHGSKRGKIWRRFQRITYRYQAFSIAGKRRGFADTRGTLFFEVARFASILRPRYIFAENVVGLLNHEGGTTYETILRTLDELGYDVEWQVLNSKAYVPQNRERVFIIGHSRTECTRQVFPIARESGAVDETIRTLMNIKPYKRDVEWKDYDLQDQDSTLTTVDVIKMAVPSKNGIVVAGQLPGNYRQTSQVYDSNGIAPTLLTKQGVTKVLIKEATKKGFAEACPGDSINLAFPDSERRRGRVGKQMAHTLLTSDEQAVVTEKYQIRKLTPRECWRLQGFPDWAYDKAAKVNSDHQLYKQAGNSVTVPVIFDIARRLVLEE